MSVGVLLLSTKRRSPLSNLFGRWSDNIARRFVAVTNQACGGEEGLSHWPFVGDQRPGHHLEP
jgi:hypothetical protein